jgi:hypothetical protein
VEANDQLHILPTDIDIHIFNRNLVDTRWQQYITHLHKNNTHHTEKGKLGSAGRSPSLRVIPWHLPYNRGKGTENPQLGWLIPSTPYYSHETQYQCCYILTVSDFLSVNNQKCNCMVSLSPWAAHNHSVGVKFHAISVKLDVRYFFITASHWTKSWTNWSHCAFSHCIL